MCLFAKMIATNMQIYLILGDALPVLLHYSTFLALNKHGGVRKAAGFSLWALSQSLKESDMGDTDPIEVLALLDFHRFQQGRSTLINDEDAPLLRVMGVYGEKVAKKRPKYDRKVSIMKGIIGEVLQKVQLNKTVVEHWLNEVYSWVQYNIVLESTILSFHIMAILRGFYPSILSPYYHCYGILTQSITLHCEGLSRLEVVGICFDSFTGMIHRQSKYWEFTHGLLLAVHCFHSKNIWIQSKGYELLYVISYQLVGYGIHGHLLDTYMKSYAAIGNQVLDSIVQFTISNHQWESMSRLLLRLSLSSLDILQCLLFEKIFFTFLLYIPSLRAVIPPVLLAEDMDSFIGLFYEVFQAKEAEVFVSILRGPFPLTAKNVEEILGGFIAHERGKEVDVKQRWIEFKGWVEEYDEEAYGMIAEVGTEWRGKRMGSGDALQWVEMEEEEWLGDLKVLVEDLQEGMEEKRAGGELNKSFIQSKLDNYLNASGEKAEKVPSLYHPDDIRMDHFFDDFDDFLSHL